MKSAGKKKPSKGEKAPAPPPPEHTAFKALNNSKYTNLVARRHALNETIKAQKKTLGELDDQLMPMMYKASALSVLVGELPVVIVESSYTKFNRDAAFHFLLKKKVDPKIVKEAFAAASTKATRAPYVKTGKSGGKPRAKAQSESDEEGDE